MKTYRNRLGCVRRNISINKNSQLQFSLLISGGIIQILIYLFNVTKYGIYNIFDQDVGLNLIFTYAVWYTIASIISVLVSLILFFFAYSFSLVDKSKLKTKDDFFNLVTKNSAMAIYVGIYIFFGLFLYVKYNSYCAITFYILISILAFMKAKKDAKSDKLSFKINYITKLQIILMLIVILISVGGIHYTTKPHLIIQKDIYGTKDKTVIFEMKGEVTNVSVIKKGKKIRVIPTRTYHSDFDSTFLVIDFTDPTITESEYLISLETKEGYIYHNIIYVFDGNLEDKNIYIDKYFIRIKTEISNSEISKVEDKLIQLKKSFTNGYAAERIQIFKELNEFFNQNKRVLDILEEMNNDRVLNNCLKIN